jgi:hypothetical protein
MGLMYRLLWQGWNKVILEEKLVQEHGRGQRLRSGGVGLTFPGAVVESYGRWVEHSISLVVE